MYSYSKAHTLISTGVMPAAKYSSWTVSESRLEASVY